MDVVSDKKVDKLVAAYLPIFGPLNDRYTQAQ